MASKFLSPTGKWTPTVLALIRILIGVFFIYHGKEIFEPETMNGYLKWFTEAKMIAPKFMAYAGKTCELAVGILLLVGFLTRLASLVALVIMIGITFYIGEGRIFMQEQHPFMFCIFAVLFLVAGGGKWSVDGWIVRGKAK